MLPCFFILLKPDRTGSGQSAADQQAKKVLKHIDIFSSTVELLLTVIHPPEGLIQSQIEQYADNQTDRRINRSGSQSPGL